MRALFSLPELATEGFLGVDYKSDAERLPLGALVRADGVRIDENGNLVGWGSLDQRLSFSDQPLAIAHYRANDELTAVAVNGTTATVYDMPVALTSATARGTFTVTSGIDIAHLVDFYERMFVSVYKEALHYLDDTTVTKLASADTDLDQDADSTDELKFRAITEYNGHLLGFGFGDEQGSGAEETGDLGPDRPEIARWSHLGQPLKWRAENWIMVGTRGNAILQGVSAFGRCACIKPEGVWLLYGDLEQNFAQTEELLVAGGISAGGVSPHGACYYDGAMYWMSHNGPMRWAGQPRAEYIGRAVENNLTGYFRNYLTHVVPVPELGCVLFTGYDGSVTPPTGDFPGGPKLSGADGQRGWLWDVRAERWVGKPDFGAGAMKMFAVAPNQLGVRRTLTHSNSYVSELEEDPTSDDPAGSNDWDVRTGIQQFNGRRGGVVRGVVLEGDWTALTSSNLVVNVFVDGSSAKTRKLFVEAPTPVATQEGDLWYDTSNDYALEWDGAAWVRQQGAPEGCVRMPVATYGRTVQVRLSVSATAPSVGIAVQLRRIAVQFQPS